MLQFLPHDIRQLHRVGSQSQDIEEANLRHQILRTENQQQSHRIFGIYTSYCQRSAFCTPKPFRPTSAVPARFTRFTIKRQLTQQMLHWSFPLKTYSKIIGSPPHMLQSQLQPVALNLWCSHCSFAKECVFGEVKVKNIECSGVAALSLSLSLSLSVSLCLSRAFTIIHI